MCSVRDAYSLRYAVNHFPSTLKLVVVLGHAQCDAVTEAVKLYLEPRPYMDIATDHSIRSIVDQIQVAVRVAAVGLETIYGVEVIRKPECRAALLEAAVVLNAAWTYTKESSGSICCSTELTTPNESEFRSPSGLPKAATSCPCLRLLDSENAIVGRP